MLVTGLNEVHQGDCVELLRSVPGAVDVTARPPTGPLLNRCLGDLRLDQSRLAGLTAAINERFRETMELLG